MLGYIFKKFMILPHTLTTYHGDQEIETLEIQCEVGAVDTPQSSWKQRGGHPNQRGEGRQNPSTESSVVGEGEVMLS